jgi:hypothetical protein
MSIARRDDWVTDAQGRALSGATVYYCTQPANTSVIPPSPLATCYAGTGGGSAPNPSFTDGFGHAFTYLEDSVFYTVVYVHPLFGVFPIILPDQSLGGGGSAGGYQPFNEVPSGAIDGSNRTFVLSVTPVFITFWVNFPLIEGLGFTIIGNTVTTALAPQVGDTVYVNGFY